MTEQEYETEQMKRCPFCGYVPIGEIGLETDIRIWCDHCGALGPPSASKDEAIERWNKRRKPRKNVIIA